MRIACATAREVPTQAILKTIPAAHREEEPPELDIVSIQPG